MSDEGVRDLVKQKYGQAALRVARSLARRSGRSAPTRESAWRTSGVIRLRRTTPSNRDQSAIRSAQSRILPSPATVGGQLQQAAARSRSAFGRWLTKVLRPYGALGCRR